jgi:hypothetical protein
MFYFYILFYYSLFYAGFPTHSLYLFILYIYIYIFFFFFFNFVPLGPGWLFFNLESGRLVFVQIPEHLHIHRPGLTDPIPVFPLASLAGWELTDSLMVSISAQALQQRRDGSSPVTSPFYCYPGKSQSVTMLRNHIESIDYLSTKTSWFPKRHRWRIGGRLWVLRPSWKKSINEHAKKSHRVNQLSYYWKL